MSVLQEASVGSSGEALGVSSMKEMRPGPGVRPGLPIPSTFTFMDRDHVKELKDILANMTGPPP